MTSKFRSGWSTEGCERVFISESHVTCRCSHLTAFAAILPAAAFEVCSTSRKDQHLNELAIASYTRKAKLHDTCTII